MNELGAFRLTCHVKSPRPATTEAGEIFEHDGLLWKALPGATSTFDEMVAARQNLRTIFAETNWNPWLRDGRQPALDAAFATFGEWTRAEPDFHQMTDEEVDRMMAEWDAESDERIAADQARYARDKERYDPERSAARLVILEQENNLRRVTEERREFDEGGRYAGWSEKPRSQRMEELGRRAAHAEAVIARLSPVMGDREEVVDEHGMLPRDRRPLNLVDYSIRCERRVRELLVEVPEIEERLKASTEKDVRSKLRSALATASRELDRLERVPPLTADDMCADCTLPLFQHGWVLSDAQFPCPAWPEHAAHMQRVREMFLSMIERSQPKAPEPPKPEPLAVVPSGLSIDETLKRLTELQGRFPDAVVRRGRAGRFELWAAASE